MGTTSGASSPLQIHGGMSRVVFSGLKCSHSPGSHRGCRRVLVARGRAQAAAGAPQ